MKHFKLLSCLLMTLMSMMFISCEKEEEEGNGDKDFKMSQLIGSEWESSYYWIDEDDGSMEEGDCVLTFSSSDKAKEVSNYKGYGYDFNPETGDNEYKPYHGTSTFLYTYTVNGNNITLKDEEGITIDYELTLSGNKLIDNTRDMVWTLLKAGEDSEETELEEKYSWSNMKGFWAEEAYEEYSAAISVYENQNLTSTVYTNNKDYGNFKVYVMDFNNEGYMRELDPYMRTHYEQGYPLLRTIHAKDATVYWTDLKPGNFSTFKYTIRGNEIYYNSQVEFKIINKNLIEDQLGYRYVRVK